MSRPVASASALALLTGVAAAADLPLPVTVEPPPVLTAPTPIAFNWSGFYLGGHGGYGFGKGAFVDGFVVGGQIGINWQFGGFVVGAEGDGSWVDWEGTDAVGTARLRGGFAFDRFLVYATGGAAFQDFDDLGWVAGGGLEYAITDNWTAGAEYLYHEFDGDSSDVFRGRVNFLFGPLGGLPPPVALVPPSMTSPAPIALNWSGFYFGGHGGYGLVSGAISDGYEIGGQLGVNHQYGKFVLGTEIDGGAVDWGPVTMVGSVRLRGGFAFNRFLAYATGGLGFEDSIGWTVGGGVDYALTERWSVGVEYLHHDFVGGDEADVVRGRVNYLFNTVRGV
jgi:outer membrane immunogenic protein